MRKVCWVWGMAVGLASLGSGLWAADETESVRAEMNALKTRIAAMEGAQMAPAAGGDCESLTSMKKKGAVQIGGDIELDTVVLHRDDVTSDTDEVDSTGFYTSTANLNFKVSASKDTYLYLKLDLDDMWTRDGGAVNQDDLLEECYFMWKAIRGSAFDLRFRQGRGPLWPGQGCGDHRQLPPQQRHGQLARQDGPLRSGGRRRVGERQPARGGREHQPPGEKDNVFMVEGTYTWKNLIKLESAVFQNNARRGGGAMTRGMFEDRSDDTLFFQSFAERLTWTPIENLKVLASVINEHCETRGDSDWRDGVDLHGVDAEADQTAASLAFDWTLKCIPLEVFGEYQHGWNWNYDDDYAVNIYQLGTIYGLTKAIDLISEVEYMGIQADDNDADVANREDLWKLSIAGKYKFENGIYMTLEYCHEWYEQEDKVGGDDRDADMVGFRTGWNF